MDAKTHLKARLPSRHVTEGPERAPHRSYYYAMGLTTKQIAQQLEISVKTVETHRANIMNKLGLQGLTELVRYAIRNKIVEG